MYTCGSRANRRHRAKENQRGRKKKKKAADDQARLFWPRVDSTDPSVGRIVRNNETRYQAEDACTRYDERVARARVACATVH